MSNNENILMEDDTVDIDPGEVGKFLQEHAQEQVDDNASTPPPTQEEGTKTITFGQDNTFDSSEDQQSKAYDDMHINLQDDQIPITQEEKESYLLAMLNEEQYEQDVNMFKNFTIRCRDLSMYEKQVVQRIITDDLKKNPNVVPAAVFMLIRQCRVPMQIVSVNGKPMGYMKFSYNPDTDVDDQLGRDAETLLNHSMEAVYSVPSARYELYMKALNVFENKLRRLQEAAFNETFWNPADQG